MLWMKPLMNILLLSHHLREKLLQIIAAWKVVPERMIIWDDLTVLYAILSDNLVNYYNLHNPPSFLLEPSMRPFKFIPQRHVAPSFASYFSAATFGHSGAIAAKWLSSILPRVR
ncbi:hypothetical protein C1H46_032745 [Malus baccata]|uniref:Uncharacterized protein n=1 Tax=Malus baccata TaxID=106549 RepID=A0A540L5C9_MALBA|nr:hypothetical protein C1H46_032745 [Malus baccata]